MPRRTLILQVTGLGHSLGQLVKFRPPRYWIYDNTIKGRIGTARTCESLSMGNPQPCRMLRTNFSKQMSGDSDEGRRAGFIPTGGITDALR